MNNTFSTSDLTLAAFLLCRDHDLTSVDDTTPTRVLFRLAPAPSAQDLADFANEATPNVNAQSFARAWRRVKRIAFGREQV